MRLQLATRLIIEEGLEAEVRDALGREYYERGGDAGGSFRNGQRKWADHQDFAGRDLGEYDIAYLFVDGIDERIRHTTPLGSAPRMRLCGIALTMSGDMGTV